MARATRCRTERGHSRASCLLARCWSSLLMRMRWRRRSFDAEGRDLRISRRPAARVAEHFASIVGRRNARSLSADRFTISIHDYHPRMTRLTRITRFVARRKRRGFALSRYATRNLSSVNPEIWIVSSGCRLCLPATLANRRGPWHVEVDRVFASSASAVGSAPCARASRRAHDCLGAGARDLAEAACCCALDAPLQPGFTMASFPPATAAAAPPPHPFLAAALTSAPARSRLHRRLTE